jgi:hypothetical protein
MAHNVVYYDTGFNGVRQFSTAEIDTLAERILRIMAAGNYAGTISIGTTNPIGTFTDTALVGSSGSTNVTVVSNVYTLSQNMTATLAGSSNAPLYVGLDTTSIPNQVSLRENITTLNQLADEILTRMVAGTGGTNAYYLGVSAPADGATWTSLGSLLNTIDNLTVTVTDYKLWERTSSGATLTNRNPLKISSNWLQSFTDAEVQLLIKTIEERIIATGIGTYVLQASAPGTGTWTNAGTIVDTRQNTQVNTYTGEINYVQENALPYASTYITTSLYLGDVSYDSVSYRDIVYQSEALYQVTYSGSELAFTTSYAAPITGGYSLYFAPDYLNTVRDYNLGGTSFTGAVPGAYISGGTNYQGPVGEVAYSGTDYSLISDYIINEYIVTYISENINTYDGLPDLSYDGTTYSGSASYLGPINYDTTVVASTQSTISTITLWRRVG